jgi:hypothetical protein
MTDYVPAIMREINSLYDVDGLFTNTWPLLGHLPVCYCAECRRLPPAGTIDFWETFNDRTVYLWKLYDAIAKEKKGVNFYFGNLGGAIHSSANLVQLGEICEWFQSDNQGRGGEGAPVWGMRYARPRLQRHSKRENGDHGDRRLVHRPNSLAQHRQVASRSPYVDE